MSNDRYQEIRDALAMGPTPGPWVQDGDGVSAADEDIAVAMCCPSDAEAAFITACDPDTIRELLAERDQLAAALEAAREDADRIAFLAMEPVIEGFVGVDRDVYEYACDCAEENGRDEPNDEDHINAMRRLIDAAIDQARGKGGEEVEGG